MLAFKVNLNNKKLCVAGPDSHGLISVITDLTHFWHREDGPDNPDGVANIDLSIGGFFKPPDEPGWDVDWVNKNLALGDKVTIEVVDVDEADPPKEKRPENSEEVEKIRKWMEKKRNE